MPRATVSTEATHYDLKTLEGGFVEIRRMPYNEWLKRTEMAMILTFEAKKGQNTKGEMEMMNSVVTAFEFKQCIVNHNLTDEDDQPLHFDMGVPPGLDPRVGNEIGEYITELHEFDSGN